MKKILLITLLFIPLFNLAQTTKPIDGFLGIKFGSSKAVVLAAIRAKGGVYDKSNSNQDMLYFENVKLGHRESIALTVRFVNDKTYEADYVFATDVEAKIPGYYADLVKDLNDVYGQGKTTRNFTSPYQEGDGNELLGLSAGKIDFHTKWMDENKNFIEAFITTEMHVELDYVDESLAAIYRTQQKAKEKSDY